MFVGKDKVIYYDVDDTLVLYEFTPGNPNVINIGVNEQVMIPLLPHQKHIESLIRHKARGSTVIVWSQSGATWAEAVVRALDLQDVVDVCISKPERYYDDFDGGTFLTKENRRYIPV